MIRPRTPWSALLALLATLLATALTVTALGVPARAADPDPAPDAEELAEHALETVQDLVEAPVEPADPAAGDVEGKNLTLALRDLAVTRNDLPDSKRATAARLLARPTDSASECLNEDLACYGSHTVRRKCNTVVCVHWVSSGTNAIPTENDGAGGAFPGVRGGTPDYVEFTLDTMRNVANTYVRAGYKKPLSDGGADGSSLPDVYLGNIGSAGAYGYCTTDEDVSGHVPAPAYCVLDNNYAEFGILPRSALRVTAAHEFFHAVQFAYDVNEDGWIMEATASWVEDELYDGINDNRAYLPYGPLAKPNQALDAFTQIEPYGTWIFFRYLSERYPTSVAGLPTIVRDIWRRLDDGGTGDANTYSLQGLVDELAAKGTSISTQLATFGMWNRRPLLYEEGRAYRAAPLRKNYTMTSSARAQSVGFSLTHLATGTYRFTRGSGLATSKITVGLNLNTLSIGAAAVITVKRRDQGAVSRVVPLTTDGNASVSYAFGSTTEWIEVTVANGDTRYNCGDMADDQQSYLYTCQGTPQQGSSSQAISVKVTG